MNNELTLALIAILPVVLIGFYIYQKDREKESKKLLLKLLLWGMLSCIPAIILELVIQYKCFPDEASMSLQTKFIYVFFDIALVEEFCKWFFVYKKTYHSQEFNHIYDAVVYSVFVALGFALLENICYIFLSGGITTAMLRAITAVPGHAIYGIIMGDYLGLAKQYELIGENITSKFYLVVSIIIPAFAHTIYDYCILTGKTSLLFVFIAFLIYLYIYSIKRVKKLSSISNNLDNRTWHNKCKMIKLYMYGVDEWWIQLKKLTLY